MSTTLLPVPVFFRDEMVADARSYSPSAGKPAAVVADWRSRGLPIDVHTFEPVDERTLCLAHDPQYVRGVLACELANGFDIRDAAVARSLPYTTGAMLAAARHAIRSQGAACAPVSGFHHAGYSTGAGFCTFNGLMVTALALRAEGLVQRVGILDFDVHYGDGTAEIMKKLGTSWITHYTSGQHDLQVEHAPGFLRDLPALARRFVGCDVLLFQAGADAHVADPLGGWMTTAELAERDRLVFEAAACFGIPVAWNLAGGYQRDRTGGLEPVLEIHRNTVVERASALNRGGLPSG